MSTAMATSMVVAYQEQSQEIRDQVEGYVRALWASLAVYREPQMRQFIAQVTPTVLGAQQHMASLTAAYLAEHQYKALGTRSRSAALISSAVTGPAIRNGTPMSEVYGRPFHLVWRNLGASIAMRKAADRWVQPTLQYPKKPAPPPEDYVDRAIKAGVDRAVNLAHTDIQLTKTNTVQRVLRGSPRVTGYRRVLEGGESCGLCIVAATLLYHKGKLMPVHPGCDCSTESIYERTGPSITPVARDGQQLIPVGELQDVHDAIAERFGESSAAARTVPGQDGLQYKDVLIEHQDGEIGPILAVRGQKFTGPADLAA